ncbi:MAG TPA: extracellular solute-binding protein [Candidatus Dormibacteraeota bacterium]|nr:extracellular solute-binding protein [Candidatus Dormibacteraeota bacterium]
MPETSHAVPRRLARLALTLPLVATLGACGSPSGRSQPALVLYSGQHPTTTAALVTAFELQTGIQVQVRSNDEDVLADQIVEEGSASPADLIYTENSPALEYLQSRSLLATVPAGTLARVPARFSSPQSKWVGVSARVSVLVYNTQLLRKNQLPTSVMSLAQSRWRGLVGIAPAETDFQPIVSSIAQRYGHGAALRWLEGMAANAGPHSYPDDETLTARVNTGQIAVAIINQYYWYRLRAEVGASQLHSALAFFAPHDPGYVLDVSGAAVLRASKDKAAADRFLAFLVSDRGQEILARGDSFEYPLAPGIPARRGLPPLTTLEPAPLSIAQLGDGASAVNLLRLAQLL